MTKLVSKIRKTNKYDKRLKEWNDEESMIKAVKLKKKQINMIKD